MSNFWINLYKFPRFLVSVLLGFFLTTFQPIFKLLKNKSNRLILIMISLNIIGLLYRIIQKMTGIK
uniref:Uncharacterized protein ycf33 n=1 Tax=Pleurostichidium falkenbergii TaxID=121064 RepID=A0A4D6UV41_9FLOR|nr:hypothetical protein [Pleurostichidium falkenbergii]QCH39732.1 hypothetical protein [Pleurostichidium falkenbergii]